MKANGNGIFNLNISYNISAVTDGTSNTIIYGEKAQGKFSQTNNGGGLNADYNQFGWWPQTYSFSTAFTTFYPMNPFNKIQLDAIGADGTFGDDWVESASSFHPGGANFAFADGSVKSPSRTPSTPAPPPGGPDQPHRCHSQHVHRRVHTQPRSDPAWGLSEPIDPQRRRDRQRGSVLISLSNVFTLHSVVGHDEPQKMLTGSLIGIGAGFQVIWPGQASARVLRSNTESGWGTSRVASSGELSLLRQSHARSPS